MNAAVALRHRATTELGVDISRVYQRVAAIGGIPKFEELYDEYVALFIEERTNLKNKQIDHELLLLREAHSPDIFSVENGFIPEDFGVSKELQLFDTLMDNQLCFEFNKHIYNRPIVEVW